MTDKMLFQFDGQRARIVEIEMDATGIGRVESISHFMCVVADDFCKHCETTAGDIELLEEWQRYIEERGKEYERLHLHIADRERRGLPTGTVIDNIAAKDKELVVLEGIYKGLLLATNLRREWLTGEESAAAVEV
jgi:hypothetical protein